MPFTGWVAPYGFEPGVVADIAAAARDLSPDLESVPSPSDIRDEALNTDLLLFKRMALVSLRDLDDPITTIKQSLELSSTELSQLFGVSRQAVEGGSIMVFLTAEQKKWPRLRWWFRYSITNLN